MTGQWGWATRLWMASWDVSRQHAPRSRAVALGVIVGLLAAVTVLRWFFDRAGESVALLYVVPIALGALRFGRRGGIAVAGFGMTAFIVLEAVRAKGDLDMTGWAAPLLVMALIGGLVGHLSEFAAQHEADRRIQAERSRQLEELCDAQRSAIELSDSIVQQMAAARWMLEAGQSSEALAALGKTVVDGIAKVSCTLPPLTHDPGNGGRPSPPGLQAAAGSTPADALVNPEGLASDVLVRGARRWWARSHVGRLRV